MAKACAAERSTRAGRPEPCGEASWALVVWVGILTMLAGGCASVPPGRKAIDDVYVTGADAVGEGELLERIATRENPRFLGLFEGLVVDYSIFNRHVFERDLARVERHYRARGYYQARARAGRILESSGDEVTLEIVVDEGPVVRVSEVVIEGLGAVPEACASAARVAAAATMAMGQPFEEDAFVRLAEVVERALVDHGFAWVQVEREADVDVVRNQARVVVRVDPGPTATLGEVTITGLGELPDAQVRTILGLRPGMPYSRAVLEEAEASALELGVFSALHIEPALGERPEGPRAVDIQVKVTPANLRGVRLGGGLQIDALQTDVHLLGRWESLNFLGGMRRFSIEARPGVTLYPLRINNWVLPERPLPKGSLHVALEQPDMFERRTRGFIRPEASVYPVLLNPNPLPDDPVLGYLDARGNVGLQRRFGPVNVVASHHLIYAYPFAYQGELNPLLGDVLLAYPELVVELDLRDDPQMPHSGFFASLAMESALFGEGRDFKVVPDARGYIPLGSRFTLAMRASSGLLFPFDYGGELTRLVSRGTPPTRRAEVRTLQLLYFRGFFGGGPGSNRGYPPRTISPYAVVPFINPASETERLTCETEGSQAAQCAVPVGGVSLWELSLALRYEISDPLYGSVFCDGADVAPGQMQIRPEYLRLSCGTGLRYLTPIGPIRFDVAYRIPGAQVLGHDDALAGNPGTIFGAPINLSFGIGEPF